MSSQPTGDPTKVPSAPDEKFGIRCFNKGAIATHAASQAFIGEILTAIQDGYGFVPFIGAGFSVAAGIPILWQFHNYLQRCICVALKAEKNQEDNELWNPRTDAWPPFIDLARPEPDPNDTGYWRELVRKRSEDKQIEEWRRPLYQEAFGAMAEWRSALHFLSRLDIDGLREETPYPVLGVPNQDVIDACLRKVLRANAPSLNQVMLATLSQVLRIDTILTTNFDDLIERAFEASRNRLEVFDVHLEDKLPDFNAVSRVRSIVKIHGSQNSLRADYSLDGPPTHEDQRTFASYVAGKEIVDVSGRALNGPGTPGKDKQPSTRNHMIIFGVGVRERRTRGFLMYALAKLHDLKLFFVCFQKSDIEQVEELMEHFYLLHPEKKEGPRCFVVRHTESGLLLLHLYQWFRKALPHSSAVFPSTTRLCLPPLPENSFSGTKFPEFVNKLDAEVERVTKLKGGLVIASSRRPVYGVTSGAAEVFRKHEVRNLCLWIEMHDIHSADDLFEAFQEAAHRKLGEADWTPLYSTIDSTRSYKDEFVRIARASSKPILLFLNARETPGANRKWTGHENGWLDRLDKPDENDGQQAFLSLLREMCHSIPSPDELFKTKPGPISVILMCREGDKSFLVENLESIPDASVVTCRKEIDGTLWDEAATVETAICWADTTRKRIFLQALLAFQRSRHLAAAWNRCTNPDGKPWSAEEDKKKAVWIDELVATKLIRRKDGGFIWFDSFFRERLRACLDLTENDQLSTGTAVIEALKLQVGEFKRFSEFQQTLEKWHEEEKGETKSRRAEINLRISMWYLRLFESTGTARAILEAIDHLMFSIDCRIRHLKSKFDDRPVDEAEVNAAYLLLEGQVDSARHLLREHAFRLQTDGHPVASKRRLKYICDYWVEPVEGLLTTDSPGPSPVDCIVSISSEGKPRKRLLKAIAKLQCVTAEISRSICREVGLESEAYECHRECAGRTKDDEPLEKGKVVTLPAARGTFSRPLSDALGKEWPNRRRHLIRWWRWSGMLGIASRSFNMAGKALCHALTVSDNKDGKNLYTLQASTLPEWIPLLENMALPQGDGKDEGKAYRCKLETLHTIEVAASCLTMQANTVGRANLLGVEASSAALTTTEYLQHAETFAVKGLRFVEEIQSSHVPDGQHDTDLAWIKSRLLVAAALASMWDPKRKQDSVHAMSLLGNAAACLRSTSPERGQADIALVELRRADVRLQEAGCQKVDEEVSFEKWMYDRLTESRDAADSKVNDLRAESENQAKQRTGPRQPHELPNLPERLQLVSASATDALRFLDRALPTLHERRRNVWWTTWYFERRLRAIALISWVSLIQGEHPIPFFGLEATMVKTATDADELLQDAGRMIRVDAYRLAMILLAYASCYRAMQVRLLFNPNEPGLARRVATMLANLIDGKANLKAVIDRRHPPKFKKGSRMDDDVENVTNKVLTLVDQLVQPDIPSTGSPR